MKKTVVIDDEARSRGLLIDLIRKFCPDLKIVGEASNVAKGLDLLTHTKVDIVFLDVEMLADENFIRIHKSNLVNAAYIKEYKKGEGGSLILEDGTEVLVSRRRKEQLLDFLMNQ